jgi:uncharacterized protein (TIGR03435 family)
MRQLSAAKKALLAAPVIIVFNAPTVRAQDKPRLAFEVASVKPSPSSLAMRQLDRDRFTSIMTPLPLIVMAYGLTFCSERVLFLGECPLIYGPVPTWLKTERYEIQGKFPDNFATSHSDMAQLLAGVNLMLQVLFEERFHLKVHRETRELQVWAITVGKNGPKLRPAGPLRMIKQPDGSEVPVHGRNSFTPVPNVPGRRQITFKAASMQQVIESLGAFADRPMVDRTGLKGEYDFEIEYDVDQLAPRSEVLPNPFTGMTCPTLSAALQDVGLKCELRKAPVEVLVIDQIERPSEN